MEDLQILSEGTMAHLCELVDRAFFMCAWHSGAGVPFLKMVKRLTAYIVVRG